MLGFMVTRSVLVPTSATYFSLMGGMLHLQSVKETPVMFITSTFGCKKKKKKNHSDPHCVERGLPKHKIRRVNFLPALAVLDDATVSNHGALLKL